MYTIDANWTTKPVHLFMHSKLITGIESTEDLTIAKSNRVRNQLGCSCVVCLDGFTIDEGLI